MGENSDSDAELEEVFVRQPEGHFQAVYDRYSGPLFRFLYRFTGNNQTSEEILQDIFLELLAGKFKSVESGTLKSWLFTVAKNRGLNHRKKSLRDIQVDLDELSSTSNLEEQVIADSLLFRLSRAEELLPVELKETWTLRKRGLDYQEIAESLSIPVGTVKSRFSRLVDYLRKEFGNES
jgi:RNA polymerase sigma-70 factor (ECF subfamily)